jgi:hypothetical protein
MPTAERRETQDKKAERRPHADAYDPFDMNFQTRRRDDPLAALYDKKIITDDF